MNPRARYWLDSRYTYFSTPYNPEFVDALKADVPYTHRLWDRTQRVWRIQSPYEYEVFELCRIYYDGAVEAAPSLAEENHETQLNDPVRPPATDDTATVAALRREIENARRLLAESISLTERYQQSYSELQTLYDQQDREIRRLGQRITSANQTIREANATIARLRATGAASRAPSSLAEAVSSVVSLAPVEAREMAYKALVKFLHPDVTPIRDKSLATSLMQTLNATWDRFK